MNYIDYIVIVLYMLGFLYLGKRFQDNDNAKDYFLGGKSGMRRVWGWAIKGEF